MRVGESEQLVAPLTVGEVRTPEKKPK